MAAAHVLGPLIGGILAAPMHLILTNTIKEMA
jgi:hypothetical protein